MKKMEVEERGTCETRTKMSVSIVTIYAQRHWG